jgi:hypothetical protein
MSVTGGQDRVKRTKSVRPEESQSHFLFNKVINMLNQEHTVIIIWSNLSGYSGGWNREMQLIGVMAICLSPKSADEWVDVNL